MDYILWSSYSHWRNRFGLISYDIACQWSVHVWDRLPDLPTRLQVNLSDVEFEFAIPKFHYAAHGDGGDEGDAKHAPFSFNNIPGAGREEGEEPERLWSSINGAAPSTKEMGPGARQDSLTNHFDHANWLKVTRIGTPLVQLVYNHSHSLVGDALRKKLHTAVTQAIKHDRLLHEFNEVLNSEHPGLCQTWKEMVVEPSATEA